MDNLIGKPVRHELFGKGRIVTIYNDNYLVCFRCSHALLSNGFHKDVYPHGYNDKQNCRWFNSGNEEGKDLIILNEDIDETPISDGSIFFEEGALYKETKTGSPNPVNYPDSEGKMWRDGYIHEAFVRTVLDDPVNRPQHYTQGKIECIDAILEATKGLPSELGYLAGNVMKYVWRHNHKGKPLEDLQKARWYLDKLISLIGENNDLRQ